MTMKYHFVSQSPVRNITPKLSNLANLVYADVSQKEAGKSTRLVKQNTQTSQRDFILVTHSKSVDYGTIIQVIEYKYHERLIDI